MARLIDADAFEREVMMMPDEELCEDCCYNVIAKLDDAPTVSGWVSVKDRLPEEKENPLTHDFAEVICFCDFGGRLKRTDIRTYKFGKRYDENEPHFWHGPQIMDGVITHWMPLPEPPEVDK